MHLRGVFSLYCTWSRWKFLFVCRYVSPKCRDSSFQSFYLNISYVDVVLMHITKFSELKRKENNYLSLSQKNTRSRHFWETRLSVQPWVFQCWETGPHIFIQMSIQSLQLVVTYVWKFKLTNPWTLHWSLQVTLSVLVKFLGSSLGCHSPGRNWTRQKRKTNKQTNTMVVLFLII